MNQATVVVAIRCLTDAIGKNVAVLGRTEME